MRRTTGALLAICALLAWLTGRFTHAISDGLGKAVCGDRYLQAVNGTVGDASCGFNADLYLTVFLMLALVAGAVLRRVRGRVFPCAFFELVTVQK